MFSEKIIESGSGPDFPANGLRYGLTGLVAVAFRAEHLNVVASFFRIYQRLKAKIKTAYFFIKPLAIIKKYRYNY